jgi:hypothetical protein
MPCFAGLAQVLLFTLNWAVATGVPYFGELRLEN